MLGEKSQQQAAYDDTNGLGKNQLAYDPDLQNATGYRDTEAVAVPAGVTERKLLNKIDWRLMPILSVLYLLAFLDRTNIANAVVFNMNKDLKLQGNQYNNALMIFL